MGKFFLALTIVLIHCVASAQNDNTYTSTADDLITIRTITILPVFDNLRGIYSRPTETALAESLKSSHRFEFVEANTTGPILTPDELSEDPTTLQNISASINADAFLSTSVIKGPKGITIKMSLFLKKDQSLLAEESVSEFTRYDVDGVKAKTNELFKNIKKKLPYSGMILSRQGTRVTVNLGRKDGVAENQELTVIQVIKLNRHPKFKFLISSDKAIIGKIKLVKVDDTLSFGRITTESEAGTIQINSKIGPLDQVTYSDSATLATASDNVQNLGAGADGKINYGNSPIEWLPKRTPTFGSFGPRLGLGSYLGNVETSTQTLETKAPFYPLIALEGELWLNPQWSIHAMIRQGIIGTSNPDSGGPDDLSHSLSGYDFLFGYNIRMGNTLRSPRIEAVFGYSAYRLFVDETGGNITTKQYSGPKIGLSGSYPLEGKSPYSLGANLNFVFQPSLRENPSTSGGGDNSVNQFSFFVDRDLAINLKARFAIEFELYSTDFDGSSVRSSSQKHTSASGGLYYLF